MQRPGCKYLALFMFMAVLSSVAHAGKGDDTAPPSVEEQPAAIATTSYFQGTWVGNWEREGRVGTGRDITITVGPKKPDGTFDIEYAWGLGKGPGGRPIPPGNVKTKGREDGGKLAFKIRDPQHLKIHTIVMTKYEDGRAKAENEFEGERGVVRLVAYLTRN